METLNTTSLSNFFRSIDRASIEIGKLNNSVQLFKEKLDDGGNSLKGNTVPSSSIRLDYSGEFGNEIWLIQNLIQSAHFLLGSIDLSLKLHDSRIQDKSKRIFDINDPYDPFKSNNDLGLVLSAIKMIPQLDRPLTIIEYLVRKGNQQQEERMRSSHYDKEKNLITIGSKKENNSFQWPEKNTFSSKQEFKNSLEFFSQIEYFKTQSSKELKELDRNFTKELKNIFQSKNNGEAPAALGPSATNSQKQKVRRIKVRKPPKLQTTPDEDYGDNFLNKVYNTTKTALELNNAKFDKSKLLVESINFENAYLSAFNKEIDYKKQISILQNEMNSLQGEDLETMNKKLILQNKITELEKNSVTSLLSDEFAKIENLELKESLLQVNQLMEALEKIEAKLKEPNLDINSENDLLKSRNLIKSKLENSTQRKPIELIPNLPEKKIKEKKKEQDPYEIFHEAFGEAKKLGSSLNTIMNNLKIGAHTFVGEVINGFGTALSVIEAILAAIQAAQAVSGIFSIFKTGLSFIPGAGPALAAVASAAMPKAGGGLVWGGSSYLVGEHGMELFTPNVGGYITSHREILELAKNAAPRPPVTHTIREPYIVTTSLKGTDLKLSLQRTERRIARERS